MTFLSRRASAAALLVVAGCATTSQQSGTATGAQPAPARIDPRTPPMTVATPVASRRDPAADARWADSVLKTLTVRQKAAQMVWVWTLGDFAPVDGGAYQAIERQVRELELGGVIVSVGGPTDIAIKINALQRASRLPLMVGADLETGAAFRARGGWFLPNAIELGGATNFPYQMGLGATRDTTLAYEMGRVTAVEGRAMGIHMAFAPVLDVNNNPKNPVISGRSFGEDPALVARMGRALVRGIQENGMLATGKHFPGHGDTEQNSHLELSKVNVSRARLDSVELRPFQAAIDAGLRGMMTFHGDLPALDTTHTAATLSKAVMTDLLRNTMKFDGLLVTDALDMNGVLGGMTMSEATLRAVEAGNDILLMPTDAKVSIQSIVDAVASGRIKESTIDAAVRKQLMAKHEFGLHANRFVDVEAVRMRVGTQANLGPANLAAEKAITLVRDSAGLVPFKLARDAKVVSITVSGRVDISAGRTFDAELRGAFPRLQSLTLTPGSGGGGHRGRGGRKHRRLSREPRPDDPAGERRECAQHRARCRRGDRVELHRRGDEHGQHAPHEGAAGTAQWAARGEHEGRAHELQQPVPAARPAAHRSACDRVEPVDTVAARCGPCPPGARADQRPVAHHPARHRALRRGPPALTAHHHLTSRYHVSCAALRSPLLPLPSRCPPRSSWRSAPSPTSRARGTSPS